jgi:hypothetical protein
VTAVGRLDPFAPRLPPRATIRSRARSAGHGSNALALTRPRAIGTPEFDDIADALKFADTEDAVVGFKKTDPEAGRRYTARRTVIRHIVYWMTALPSLAKPSNPGRAAPNADRVSSPATRTLTSI